MDLLFFDSQITESCFAVIGGLVGYVLDQEFHKGLC